MKKVGILVLVLLLIVVVFLKFASFQVRETEMALVLTLGKATGGEITKPGWRFRWPAPIQSVRKFDSRLRVFSPEMEEATTKGRIPLIVNTYVVWRISEPLKFYNGLGSVKEAESQLLGRLRDAQNNVIGNHYFSDFVNSDKSKIHFDDIQNEMLADVQAAVSDMGIEVKSIGIKQLKIPETVTKEVFARMSAERSRKIADTTARGAAQAKRIRSDADAKKTEILAVAEARAKAIMGQGDAEAARYYKDLEADPKLAMFLRDLDALKTILENRTTIVLGTDIEPFKLLKEIPDLKNNDQGTVTGPK